MTKEETVKFVMDIYLVTKDCTVDELEQVLNNTMGIVEEKEPDVAQRTKGFMQKVKSFLISQKMQEAIN